MVVRITSRTHRDVDFVFGAKEDWEKGIVQSCGAENVESLEIAVFESVVNLGNEG